MSGKSHVAEGGTIVSHRRSDGTFFLVIRRKDGWSFPKGHRESQDGDLAATAVRELEEEAGIHCTIKGPVGVHVYDTGNERKSVHFFAATYAGPGSNENELDGVTQTVWLRRDDAARQLSYDDLREFFLKVTAPPRQASKVSRRLRRNVRLDRLASALDVFRVEVEALRVRNADTPAATKRRASVDRLIELAEECVASRRVDAGWEALHAARRLGLYELSEDELRGRADALRAEATDKLTKWRRKAALELLEPADRIPRGNVEEAARLLDDHSMNLYLKLRLSRTALPIAATLLGLILVALGLAVRLDWFDGLGEEGAFVLTDFGLFGGVAVLGAFGAMLSLALDRDGASLVNRRIYEVATAHFAVPVARLSIGAASGVVVVAAVQSSLADLGQQWAILAAIPAGFSERLVRRSVESLDLSASSAQPNAPESAPDS